MCSLYPHLDWLPSERPDVIGHDGSQLIDRVCCFIREGVSLYAAKTLQWYIAHGEII